MAATSDMFLEIEQRNDEQNDEPEYYDSWANYDRDWDYVN